jgi:hypothetical protein
MVARIKNGNTARLMKITEGREEPGTTVPETAAPATGKAETGGLL